MTEVKQPLENCEERERKAKRFGFDYSLLVKKTHGGERMSGVDLALWGGGGCCAESGLEGGSGELKL